MRLLGDDRSSREGSSELQKSASLNVAVTLAAAAAVEAVAAAAAVVVPLSGDP